MTDAVTRMDQWPGSGSSKQEGFSEEAAHMESGIAMSERYGSMPPQGVFSAQDPHYGQPPAQRIMQDGRCMQGGWCDNVPQPANIAPVPPPFGQPLYGQPPFVRTPQPPMGFAYAPFPVVNADVMRLQQKGRRPSKRFSIASLVCAIVGFAFCLASIVGYLCSITSIVAFVLCIVGAVLGVVALFCALSKKRS